MRRPSVPPDCRTLRARRFLATGDYDDHDWYDDIFLRDRTTGTTTRISRASAGGSGDGISQMGTIITSGRHVAFASGSTNPLPGDTNNHWSLRKCTVPPNRRKAHSCSSAQIWIRRALGATTRHIRNLVLREAAVSLVAGLTIGVSVSVALAPVIEPILVRVSGVDPAILGAASLTLAVAAVAGCLLPARHALQIDPAIILRHD